MAMCLLIDSAIGHADSKRDLEHLSYLCHKLGYDQERFNAVVAAAAAAYAQDRGRGLVASVVGSLANREK